MATNINLLNKRRKSKKTRKVGGVGSKRISMKSLSSALDLDFGKKAVKASRKQPSRISKSNTAAIFAEVNENLKKKQETARTKRDEKKAFNEALNELADRLEKVKFFEKK